MAMLITEHCINCGRCVPVCPGQGISKSREVFEIDPFRCVECVGFHPEQQCVRVCPVDCCVTDPKRVEDEATLFERARNLFPNWRENLVLSPKTSHFRKLTLPTTLKKAGRRLAERILGPSIED